MPPLILNAIIHFDVQRSEGVAAFLDALEKVAGKQETDAAFLKIP